MTFVEAAVEVLRREGKALTVDRLTQLAVQHRLLSVVGRNPEQTMSERLEDAIARDVHDKLGIRRVKPGVFGLTVYPVPDAKTADAAPAATVATATAPAQAMTVASTAADVPAADSKPTPRKRTPRKAVVAPAVAAPVAAEVPAAAKSELGESAPVAPAKKPRARRGKAADAAAAKEAEAALAAAAAKEASEAASRADAARVGVSHGSADADDMGAQSADADDREYDIEDLESSPHPAMLVTPGMEELVRSGDERMQQAEVHSHARDRERGRHRHHHKDGGKPRRGDSDPRRGDSDPRRGEAGPRTHAAPARHAEARPTSAQAVAPGLAAPKTEASSPGGALAPGERGGRRRRGRGSRGQGRMEGTRSEGAPHVTQANGALPSAGTAVSPIAAAQVVAHVPSVRSVNEPSSDARRFREFQAAIADVLSQHGGRMHVQKLSEELLRRHLVDGKGGHAELVTRLKATLARRPTPEEMLGATRTIVMVGGGQVALTAGKLEPELLLAEDELRGRLDNVRERTARALGGRLCRLRPSALEAIVRVMTERLGLRGFELVRRSSDVAYFGGECTSSGRSLRTLIAVWPTGAGLQRRAVGELRAGLSAKGFAQGWLFSPGALSPEAIEEWKVSPNIEVHAGDSLVQLCLAQQIGTRRVPLVVDSVDPGFWSELDG